MRDGRTGLREGPDYRIQKDHLSGIYGDSWDLLEAVKYNLRQHAASGDNIILDGIKTWNIGFVFGNAVYPVVTVFPLTKIFHPRRSGGFQHVEYRLSVDIYSKRYTNQSKAKEFCLKAVDDVKKCVKKRVRMIDKNQTEHCFTTSIVSEVIYEGIRDAERGFRSSASVEISCLAYHQMDEDRVHYATITDGTYNDFFDKVTGLIRTEAIADSIGIKKWVYKTTEPVLEFPAVAILPGDEVVDESRTNRYVELIRPVRFHVITRGYPKSTVLKQNIKAGDRLVSAIEKMYMLEGYAQDCQINSVDFVAEEGGWLFMTVIDTEYRSRSSFGITYQ